MAENIDSDTSPEPKSPAEGKSAKWFFQPRRLSRLNLSYLLGLVLSTISICGLLYMKVFVGTPERLNNIRISIQLDCREGKKAATYNIFTGDEISKFQVNRYHKDTDTQFRLNCKETVFVSRTDFESASDAYKISNPNKEQKGYTSYRNLSKSNIGIYEYDLENILHRTSFAEYETFIEFWVRSNNPDVKIKSRLTIPPPSENWNEETPSIMPKIRPLTTVMMRPQPDNLDEALSTYSRFQYAPRDVVLKKSYQPKDSTRAPSYSGKQAYYIKWVDQDKERLEDILSILLATLLGVSISLIAEAFIAGGHRKDKQA